MNNLNDERLQELQETGLPINPNTVVDFNTLSFDDDAESDIDIPDYITDEEPQVITHDTSVIEETQVTAPAARVIGDITVIPTDDISNADVDDNTEIYELSFQLEIAGRGMDDTQIKYLCDRAYNEPSIVKHYFPDMKIYHPCVRPELEQNPAAKFVLPIEDNDTATDTTDDNTTTTPVSVTPNSTSNDDDDDDNDVLKQATTGDTLMEAITAEYLKENPVTMPDLLSKPAVGRKIREDIINLYRTNRSILNTNLPKGDNIEVRRAINGTCAAQIVLSTGDIRIMWVGTDSYKVIMKRYYRNKETGWKFKWSGTWMVLSDVVDDAHPLLKIFRVLCPNRERSEKPNYLAKLKDAPEAVFAQDNKVVFYRNGVFDYRTRQLVDYDDPDYDEKVKVVTLHKLPVNHPLGKGAILKPYEYNGTLMLDEPVYHNDADNFDWSPSQLLTDPFDMTTDVGKACNLILWQAMQFLTRHMSGGDGWYHFWVNARGEGRNCKGTLWDMMRRLIVKKYDIEGDEDLDRVEGLTVPMAIEELGKDFNLSTFILNCWAIVGEETDSATQTDVDKVAIIKNLSRNDEITYRPIREKAFTFAFHGFLCQQSNRVPRFREKSDSVSTHAIVIPFDRSFKDNAKRYIKKDYVLREETAEYLAWVLTMEMDALDDYDAHALKVLEPFKKEMMKASINTHQFFDLVLPCINLTCMPAEFLYSLYRHYCDKNGIQGRSVVAFRAFQEDMEQYGLNNDNEVIYTTKNKRFPKLEVGNWIDALVEFGGRTSCNAESEYRSHLALQDYQHQSAHVGHLEPSMFCEYDKNGNLTKGKIFSRGCFIRKVPYNQMNYGLVVEDDED